MATINPKKIDKIETMLLKIFPNNDPVAQDYLSKKVDDAIIMEAKEKGLIFLSEGKYTVTLKGRKVRDN